MCICNSRLSLPSRQQLFLFQTLYLAMTFSLTPFNSGVPAVWVSNFGENPRLYANGVEIDPALIPGYKESGMMGRDRRGNVASQKGCVYLSTLPSVLLNVTIKGSKTERYAILQGSHFLYRGNLYHVPECIEVTLLEKVTSSNGNHCVVLPEGLILTRA